MTDPLFISYDPQTVWNEMVAQFEADTGTTFHLSQYEYGLLKNGQYRELIMRVGINEAAKLNLVRFSREPIIDYIGERFGVTRLEAVKAVTTIRFTLLQTLGQNYVIDTGVQVGSADGMVIFETTEPGIIAAGQLTVDIPAECTVAGTAGNGYAANTITQLKQPLQYVDSSAVQNTTATSGGAARETTEHLKERILLAPSSFSVAGPEDAYIYYTKSAHPSVIDAAIEAPENEPCVVKVYPLMSTGIPTNAEITTIQTYLSYEKRRPLTDKVEVEAPTQVDYTISVTVQLFLSEYHRTAEIKAQIETALRAYAADRRAGLGRDIVPSKIMAICQNISGVYKVSTPAQPIYTKVLPSEWAYCADNDVTVNIDAVYENG
ncbi:MAG TPA: baseplate J/gp47 family protein [bacterium]|nr:baseplate J/gp47 family protein [bacterium]